MKFKRNLNGIFYHSTMLFSWNNKNFHFRPPLRNYGYSKYKHLKLSSARSDSHPLIKTRVYFFKQGHSSESLSKGRWNSARIWLQSVEYNLNLQFTRSDSQTLSWIEKGRWKPLMSQEMPFYHHEIRIRLNYQFELRSHANCKYNGNIDTLKTGAFKKQYIANIWQLTTGY